MPETSPTRSSAQKRSSQENMEVYDGEKTTRGDSSRPVPPSQKKVKSEDEFMEEDEGAKSAKKPSIVSPKEEAVKEEPTGSDDVNSPYTRPEKKGIEKDEDMDKSRLKSPVASSSKKPKDQFLSDLASSSKKGKDEVATDSDHMEASPASSSKKPTRQVKKSVKAAILDAFSDCFCCLCSKRPSLTSNWTDDKPSDNVERPIPTPADRENYCWYNARERWAADRLPGPVPVKEVDYDYNYGVEGYASLPFAELHHHRSLGTSQRQRGRLIAECMLSFSNGIRDLDHLEEGIRKYWSRYKATTLRKLCDNQPESVQKAFLETLTGIAKIALKARHIVTRPLPMLLSNGENGVKSVSMSQEQAACLLAYAFFCAQLPCEDDEVQHFTLHMIHLGNEPVHLEKMKFILYYFKAIIEEMPRGTLTFSRQAWDSRADERRGYDKWEEPLSELRATSEGLIEEMTGCLQVDFANEYIGGGVMNRGAVQEEIRFLCCPEMLVSLLICQKMESNEAILIQGAQQFSAYTGYASGLKHAPMKLIRDEPRDQYGRARSYLVAIDAICFERKQQQYRSEFISREVKKAYAGFMRTPAPKPKDAESRPSTSRAAEAAAAQEAAAAAAAAAVPQRPIATGNWGCGVFNGDKELKSMIQLISASKARRAMIYVTFGDEEFAAALEDMYDLLKAFKVTNGQLFALLVSYEKSHQLKEGVFDYLKRVVQAGFHQGI